MANVRLSDGADEFPLLSPKHLVQTVRGWIKAKELKVGDKVINFKGGASTVEKIMQYSKALDAPTIVKKKQT